MINVTIPHRGYISQLKRHGPILHPTAVSEEVAMDMLLLGIPVYKYNGRNDQVALTIEMINGTETMTIEPPSSEDDIIDAHAVEETDDIALTVPDEIEESTDIMEEASDEEIAEEVSDEVPSDEMPDNSNRRNKKKNRYQNNN